MKLKPLLIVFSLVFIKNVAFSEPEETKTIFPIATLGLSTGLPYLAELTLQASPIEYIYGEVGIASALFYSDRRFTVGFQKWMGERSCMRVGLGYCYLSWATRESSNPEWTAIGLWLSYLRYYKKLNGFGWRFALNGAFNTSGTYDGYPIPINAQIGFVYSILKK